MCSKGTEVVTWRTSRKKLGLLSVLQSAEFTSVVFKAVVVHCSIVLLAFAAVKSCDPFTQSEPRCMRHEPRRIECCCGLTRTQLIREYAQLHDLVIIEIFDSLALPE